MRSIYIAGLFALAAADAGQEVTLRAVSSLSPRRPPILEAFERFIEKVNADGKGVIRSTTSAARRPCRRSRSAMRCAPSGVVDIANVTGAFYTNLMPEADAWKLTGKPMSEQRKNGGWDYINQLHNRR